MPNSPQQMRDDLAVMAGTGRCAPMIGTESDYRQIVRNLDADTLASIESIDGPSDSELASPKIRAARNAWLSLPHEVRLKIAFSAA